MGTCLSAGASGDADLLARFPPRPWARQGGLADEVLLEALRRESKPALTKLYFAGIEAGFCAECEAYRQAFVACCVAVRRTKIVKSKASPGPGLLTFT